MKFNKLIPELSVSDFRKSLKFYTCILGFKIEYQRQESRFAFLSLQGSQIMLEQMNDTWKTGTPHHPFGRGINFQIEVKDIRPLMDRLKKNNHRLFAEPKDNWYRKGKKLLGNREFLVQDPDGDLLRFAQNLGTRALQ